MSQFTATENLTKALNRLAAAQEESNKICNICKEDKDNKK